MKVDLHTHTNLSDGRLSPAQLIDFARSRSVDMLALTDHDTDKAHSLLPEYIPPDIKIIYGIEFSCQWQGIGIHVLGYGMQPTHPELVTALAFQHQIRRRRSHSICQRLGKLGISGLDEWLEGFDCEAWVGRPQIARYLVAQGHAKDINRAFKLYLGAGKVGDVRHLWADLSTVVKWITTAGGVAVLAHPARYKMTNAKLRRLLVDFRSAGGAGLEVVSGRQLDTLTHHLHTLARDYGLYVSVGSDMHHPDQSWTDPAHLPILNTVSRPIWELF